MQSPARRYEVTPLCSVACRAILLLVNICGSAQAINLNDPHSGRNRILRLSLPLPHDTPSDRSKAPSWKGCSAKL